MPTNSSLTSLFEKAATGYLAIDQSGLIVAINPYLYSRLAVKASDFVGQAWQKLLANPDMPHPELKSSDNFEIQLRSSNQKPLYFNMALILQEDKVMHFILHDISSHINIEAEISNRNEFLQEIFENSQDAIVVINEESIVTGWSKKAENLFGWNKSEAMGQPLDELIVPERFRQAHKMGMQRYLSTKESRIIDSRTEITAIHKDGHELPIELTINKIMLDGVIQFSAFVRNISRRKRIQQTDQSRSYILELLAKGASLRTILLGIIEAAEQQIPESMASILLMDRDGRHLRNGAAPKLPQDYNDAIDGIEIGMGVGCCGTAAYTGERVIVEDIQTHPYWRDYKHLAAAAELASCWSQPIFSSQGKVLGTFAIYHDKISAPTMEAIDTIESIANLAGIAIEKYLAQEQLELLETSISHLNDIVIITEAEPLDKSGPKILFVNDAFERITGYTKDDVINQSPRILQGPKTQRDELDKIHEALRKWQPVRAEVLNYKKSGEEIWLELEIVPIKDSSGWYTHWVAVERDITERKNSENAIKHLAFYDPLTGLPNRALLLDRLQHTIAAANRTQHHGALLFIDLDNFKTLNDTQGHDVGDELLKQVAVRLSNCVREVDTVARIGGDEFVVMLADLSMQPEEAAAMAKNVGEKILDKFTSPFMLKDHEYMSSPSIGITLFNHQINSIDLLLKRADLAMYQAKAAGKNMMRFFDPEMQNVVTSKAAMESYLRNGIEDGSFLAYYQPQVDIDCNILGFEVLIRWNHPELGIIAPSEFISLAEETGLIVPMGMWVIQQACEQLAKWHSDPLFSKLYLSVNVSAKQFRHPEFVEQVLKAVNSNGIDPGKLKLELTESILVASVEETIIKMSTLKSMGIGFALDDFGTGYSSLAYLKRLPLDQLKIDRSFVRDVLVDPNDAIIIRTIIALGNSMGLSVIAEGVETAEQQTFLAEIGCYSYQGYLFGKPEPLKSAELYVKGNLLPPCN